jgi:hypothetical protein
MAGKKLDGVSKKVESCAKPCISTDTRVPTKLEGSVDGPLTEVFWRNCESSEWGGSLANITLEKCVAAPDSTNETTCIGKYAGAGIDDVTYDMDMKAIGSGSGPYPEPHTLHAHCKGDASEPKPCDIEYPMLGHIGRSTLRPIKLPVMSGEFAVTVGVSFNQSAYLPGETAHAFFFQGASKSGVKLFCLEFDIFNADSATNSKLTPLVVVV